MKALTVCNIGNKKYQIFPVHRTQKNTVRQVRIPYSVFSLLI